MKEAKLLVVNSGSRSSDCHISSSIGNFSSNSSHDSSNSVGMDPTENASVRQKKQGSTAFQEIKNSQRPDGVLTDDYFSSLIADRLKDEALEVLENSSTGDRCMNRFLLLLTSELAEQIYSDVNANRTSSEIIPEFELEHDGIWIRSVRMLENKITDDDLA